MENLVIESEKLYSLYLKERALSDLELLLNGGFFPLQGYLSQKDYESVLSNYRLSSGALWPMPIVLPVTLDQVKALSSKKKIALRDEQANPLAILSIEEIYKPNRKLECELLIGTTDPNHPYADWLLKQPDLYYIGGTVQKIALPKHHDFYELRYTPEQLKDFFQKNQWETIVAFQTRNPLHRSHIELIHKGMQEVNQGEKVHALLHPVTGQAQHDDIDYITRVRCYKKIIDKFPENTVKLALLPLSMRMAGPREALWHALIRANYGCTHFIIGRDHAGPSKRQKSGGVFYHPLAAQEFVLKYQHELPIQIITSSEIVYLEELHEYCTIEEAPSNAKIFKLSGTQLRKSIINGDHIPDFFSYPEVINELRRSYQKVKGICISFTGLPSSGKSTLAQALRAKFLEVDEYCREITVLDGDMIRNYISNELGFSSKDRSINTKRIGFVASLIVRHGGICFIANIAPYKQDRAANRALISKEGLYFEIYVNTPQSICEQRDPKGLYKAAKEGRLSNFTGISDPYEIPEIPDIKLDGSLAIDRNVELLFNQLKKYMQFSGAGCD